MIEKKFLIKFEKEIAKLYEQGKVHAPVHLAGSKYGNQEKFLIRLFKKIKRNDWIFQLIVIICIISYQKEILIN